MAVNFSPRSSADENMSNDAHAGESSTTSPGRPSRARPPPPRRACPRGGLDGAFLVGRRDRRRDLIRSATDQDRSVRAEREHARELAEVGALETPRVSRTRRTFVRRESRHRRGRRGRSGVVDPEEPLPLGDGLEASGHASNSRRARPMTSGGMSNASPTIAAASAFANVVPSGHAELGRLAQDRPAVTRDEHQVAVRIEVGAALRSHREREAAHLGRGAGVKGDRGRIVEIEDGDVPRTLPGNDVLLRGDVRVAGP